MEAFLSNNENSANKLNQEKKENSKQKLLDVFSENISTQSNQSETNFSIDEIEKRILKNYEEKRMHKKISCNLNLKMNHEREKLTQQNCKKVNEILKNWAENDSYIEQSLENQLLEIQKRVTSRKIVSLIKNNNNFSFNDRFGNSMLGFSGKNTNSSFFETENNFMKRTKEKSKIEVAKNG